ncbi:glutaminase family protein [Sedimentisphaera salicampi]|uniref:glutaminase family protein n=1 Tax=Sedimentisphaera salicampi TaxID=1941349 RepID=UPI000B9C5C61|nr:glutaminase family protein [Sedimentisphaera salicampi]OXU16118.1 hypothetical protein SMSP1_00287 [Sedimentisphaera salicampi]
MHSNIFEAVIPAKSERKSFFKRVSGVLTVLLIAFTANASLANKSNESSFRPPSVPLIACDPYFSIWSPADELYGSATCHWTGTDHPLVSMVRIDGKTYRLMGNQPEAIDPAKQISLDVYPTRTVYTFQAGGAEIQLEFMQAALPDDIDLLSQPVVWLEWEAKSVDGKSHDISVYMDAGMDLAVHQNNQYVEWSKPDFDSLNVLKTGTQSQNVLARKGDNVRIDWGYFYMAAPKGQNPQSQISKAHKSRAYFAARGDLPGSMDKDMPRRVEEDAPVMAYKFDRKLKSGQSASCRMMLAYDDIKSVLYFGDELEAYWKKDGKTIEDVLARAAENFNQVKKRCKSFDKELMQDLKKAGGDDYVKIASLAYRQAFSANKVVADENGMPLMFSKENFSNGCMGTVDVFYPFAPQVLLLNPTLAKASFVPILEYGRSDRWKFPFAPHDVGTYPHAMGQVYGGGERSAENQMPVEECGNMILLTAAAVKAEGDVEFARKYWDILSSWAEYLKSKGLDPENQLCTDDFAGHLAHNVNLSMKAIVSLAAYADMADMMGEKARASLYRRTAQKYAKQWMEMADDGDHYRLAFDKPGTWSQKYNLVWDRILDLNLFPDSVARTEMEYYKNVQNKYGLPLDNRSKYTKLDWIFWTASITGSKKDFKDLIAPVRKFINETPDRVPMTDWYWTHNAEQRGFQARPVVGGVFIKLMDNKKVWNKWVENAGSVAGQWAPLPKPPKIEPVVEMSYDEPKMWYYTFDKPANENWYKPSFDPIEEGWSRGAAGFGTSGTPSAEVNTVWETPNIWITRKFHLDDIPEELELMIHHDEDATVYINGKMAAKLYGYTSSPGHYKIKEEAFDALKQGKNTMAIHCRQTTGGQYIDAGLAQVIEQD